MIAIEADQKLNGEIGERERTGQKPKSSLMVRETEHMAFERVQMLDSVDKEFKSAIINMLKELKETLFKELKVL